MRWLLGFLLVAHGVAHLPGFLVDWRWREMAELPYRTTVLGGALDVGEAGTRVIGLLWLATAVAFALVGASGRWPWAWGALAISTLLCVLVWPETKYGLAMNALLAVLLVSSRAS